MRIYVFIVIAGHILGLASRPALAEQNIKMCSSGSITLRSFSDHLAELRKSGRYPAEEIDDSSQKRTVRRSSILFVADRYSSRAPGTSISTYSRVFQTRKRSTGP